MSAPTTLLRERGGEQRVSNAELFFDLVYVYAVTQLSHHLLENPTVTGALQTALLLALVWLAWVYTTWVTNWLDPERIPVRLMLMASALASLVMSLALPQAFDTRGWAVAGAYVVMQVGRSIFVVIALRREGETSLRRNYERILCWSLASGVLALLGAAVSGHARALLWLAAVLVDLAGGACGFYTPGLGRSRTDEWTIEGGHFAERCQAFVLIALGESVVVIGATLADFAHIGFSMVAAFVAAFLGAIGLWWIYFDRSADEAAEVIAASDDPGRLGRSAYHSVHPIMVAGIIVTAAADNRVLDAPTAHADRPTAWLVLGGCALFLAGHALFKWIVWRTVPLTRIIAVVLLAIMLPFATHLTGLVLGVYALAVILAVIISDRLLRPAHE